MTYCKKLDSLIHMSLQKSLAKEPVNLQEILAIVKHMSSIKILNSKDPNRGEVKISPESVACQVSLAGWALIAYFSFAQHCLPFKNLVYSLCANYQIILNKTIAFEEESDQLRKQLQYLHGYNNSQVYIEQPYTLGRFQTILACRFLFYIRLRQ